MGKLHSSRVRQREESSCRHCPTGKCNDPSYDLPKTEPAESVRKLRRNKSGPKDENYKVALKCGKRQFGGNDGQR